MTQLTDFLVHANLSGLLMGAMTLGFFSVFSGWVIYAYAPARRLQFEAAGRMALDDEEAR